MSIDAQKLIQAEKILVRERALNDLFFFATEILGYRDFGQIHRILCHELEGRSKTGAIVWLLPRFHFKTTLINEAYNLWLQVQKQRRILLVSATLSVCEDMVRRLKIHIRGEKFKRYFPEINIVAPDRGDQIFLEGNRWGEANFEITSPEHNVVAKHYDKIVLDDIVNNENANTDAGKKKLLNWYQTINGLKDNPNVPVDIIGTRWSDADLYGHLIDDLRIPYFLRGAYDPKDPQNTILFPERINFEQLEQIKASAGESVFACQFLNDPLAGEHAVFQSKHLRYTELTKEESERHFRILCIDPAISQKDEADNTAIVMMSRDAKGDIYIHGVRFGKWKTLEIIEMIYKTRDDFNPNRIAIEAEGFQKTLVHFMDEVARNSPRPVYVEPFKSGRSLGIKELRVKSLAPFYEGGRIWHVRDGENIAAFEAELLRFPKGKHDDMVDAASYGFNILSYGSADMVPEESNTVNQWLKAIDQAKRKAQCLGHENTKWYDNFDFSPL